MLHKAQIGRSMIEMLGVLAIIGVLSVGGLAGYSKAMQANKINNILDYMNRAQVEFKARKASGFVQSRVPIRCETLLNEAPPTGTDKCQFQDDYSDIYDDRIVFHFTIRSLFVDVATKLQTSNAAYAKTCNRDKFALICKDTECEIGGFYLDAFD